MDGHIHRLVQEVAELTDGEMQRFGEAMYKARASREARLVNAGAGVDYGNAAAPIAEQNRKSYPGIGYEQAKTAAAGPSFRMAHALGVFVAEDLAVGNIDELMTYKPWDVEQEEAGTQVREVLSAALKTILRCVPRSPTRTVACRKIVEARMDCNAAITHRGRF
jgi:hypothetical protein